MQIYMQIDKKKLALIHIIKKELNLNDIQYRDILREAAGVESAKDLNEETFRKLMNYFVRSPYYQLNQYGLTIRQKLYIKFLTQSIGWEETHLNNFIHKYYHKPNIERLTKREATKVIEALKNIKEHKTEKAKMDPYK